MPRIICRCRGCTPSRLCCPGLNYTLCTPSEGRKKTKNYPTSNDAAMAAPLQQEPAPEKAAEAGALRLSSGLKISIGAPDLVNSESMIMMMNCLSRTRTIRAKTTTLLGRYTKMHAAAMCYFHVEEPEEEERERGSPIQLNLSKKMLSMKFKMPELFTTMVNELEKNDIAQAIDLFSVFITNYDTQEKLELSQDGINKLKKIVLGSIPRCDFRSKS